MDHLDVYKRLSQPVDERKDEDIGILKFVDGDVGAIQNMDHLRSIRELAEKVRLSGSRRTRERIILLCSRPELAKQAAMAYETLLVGLSYEDRPQGMDESGPEDQEAHTREVAALQSLFQGCFEEDEEDEDEGERWFNADEESAEVTVDLSKDYLALTLEQFAPGSAEKTSVMSQIQMLQVQGQDAKLQMLLRQADKLFLDGFDGTLTDKLIDRIGMSFAETVMLALPDRLGNEYFIKRLSFEQGFEILTLDDPRDEYYLSLIDRYLKARKLELKDLKAQDVLQRIRRYRKGLFEEKDLIRYIDLSQTQAGSRKLEPKDFSLYGETGEEQGIRKLESLIGLSEVKCTIKSLQAICREEMKKESSHLHTNLAFAGNPGTGKSVVARLYGEILSDIGLSNGRFVIAGRQDMIGQYVGHTAPMICDLFKRARGGVLFIDEAGCLLQKDTFSREAVTELVRYMEEQPETTVIFASYPEEIQKLLQADPGFSSRIRRTLIFADYSQEELLKIMELMAKELDLRLTKGSRETALSYLQMLRAERKESFGNAREVRKLLENAYEQFCLRNVLNSRNKETPDRVITEKDMQQAVQALMPKKPAAKQRIGFVYPVVHLK